MIQTAMLALAFSVGVLQDPPPQPPQVESQPAYGVLPPDPHPFSLDWEWAEPPVPLYPLEALVKDTKSGSARMRCRAVNARGVVSDCEVLSETPDGQGFGAEQLAAMPAGRLSPAGIERMQREGSLSFTTTFRPPDDNVHDAQGRVPDNLPPYRRRGTTSFAFDGRSQRVGASWDIPPSVAIPERAQATGLYDGFAVVGCTRVSDDRVLSSCFVFAEEPPGSGLGQAVLRAMPQARATQEAAEAVRRGDTAMFRIRFSLRE